MKSTEYWMLQFAECCIGQTEAMKEGNAKVGNRYAKRRNQAFNALRARGDVGRDALAPLMHHQRSDVRQMAAVYLLRYRHAEARKVLEELSRGESFTAFGAREALKRWDEGTWQLDPE